MGTTQSVLKINRQNSVFIEVRTLPSGSRGEISKCFFYPFYLLYYYHYTHLDCCTYNVSAVVLSGHLQVSVAVLDNSVILVNPTRSSISTSGSAENSHTLVQ